MSPGFMFFYYANMSLENFATRTAYINELTPNIGVTVVDGNFY